MKRLAVTMMVTLALGGSPAAAAVPGYVSFQGRLLQSDGSPEVGIVAVGFALYDASTGGAPLWSETQTVAFQDGFYAVLLGTVSPLPISSLDAPRFLGVTIAGTELLPRMEVASVVFALKAEVAENLAAAATGSGSGLDADSVDGLDATDFATSGHTHAAGDADTLDGIDSSGFSLSSHSHAAGDADTLDGVDSSGFSLSSHTHAAGDADTLDGVDSTGFSVAGHIHPPGAAIDWSGMTTLSSGTYDGATFASNLIGGVAMCPASYHTCNAWEWAVFDILGRGNPGAGWVTGGFNNIDAHMRSLINGQDSTVCPVGSHLRTYTPCCGNEPGWGGYYGRLHCVGDASIFPVMCCRNTL